MGGAVGVGDHGRETERVVELVLEHCVRRVAAVHSADACTGSGCLAGSIAHEYPAARIVATDLSVGALTVARRNAERHHVADRIEFLQDDPSLQPHHAPYIKNLGTLGIEATMRVVDPVQYRARLDEFDFDITIERFSMSAPPGDAIRPFFSSQAAAPK